MPRNHKRIRVERGLCKAGEHYYACATPAGSRGAVWKALGPVNLMEARRLRDKFCAQVQGAPAPALTNSRRSFGDLAAEWLDEQKVRVDVGEMSPRTYEIHELGLRRHVLPVFARRQVRAIDPDALVAWIRALRAAGYAPHSTHNYWGPLHLVLAYAVRAGVIASNPADRLTAAERPKPGSGRRRFLGRDELEQLLDAAPERYRLPLACGLFSGVRLSELLGLTWEEIDFAGATIRVRFQMGRDGKRRQLKTAAARRDVILMSELGAQLRRWRLASPFSRGDDLVFCATIAQGHDPVFVSR